MCYLAQNSLFWGRVLDYGCGRGFDADQFMMLKYDPFYFPILPEGKFNFITCIYVFNVIEKEEEKKTLEKIKSLLIEGGIAYIAVRRDMKVTKKQRYVVLDLERVVLKPGQFEIYKMVNI